MKSYKIFIMLLLFFTAVTFASSFSAYAVAKSIVENDGRETSGIACTEEAKLCPDGSSVVRQGPNCEFSECPATKQPLQRACTMDAKICPDGSAVSRTGPNCEFAPCPEEK